MGAALTATAAADGAAGKRQCICVHVSVWGAEAAETIDCRPGDERRAGRAVERLMPDNRLIGWNIHDSRFWERVLVITLQRETRGTDRDRHVDSAEEESTAEIRSLVLSFRPAASANS